MESLYPAGPSHVPEGLTAPSPVYRRQAWLAVLSLLAFALLYSAMMLWLGWTAWRVLGNLIEGNADNVLSAGLVGGGAALLAIFMAKSLVFIRRGAQPGDLEITEADQPRLFAFIHRLADEAGAPRPHRVFLSPRVNAAVFYDLSLLNLLLPSRKNLEIGLGLVNVLSLSEFKAVLAHEFGHFAQRTMAVGRWVYVAQQIAEQIIHRRDAFDKLLAGLSGIDLRVAWIGWILRIVVWSIRSLVELFFRAVVLAQRALSREMEYQADLVSASLSGSDALVHALHKLGAADDAWERAVGFAGERMGRGHAVADLFAVQDAIIEHMRRILADPDFGRAPALPGESPHSHRIFRDEIAQPPRMWSTHPANSDRERNVKQVYLPAPLDERQAWMLFDQTTELREQVSRRVFSGDLPPVEPVDASLAELDRGFQRPSLHRRYRGSFLGRSVVRHASELGELYALVPPGTDLLREIDRLYDDAHDRDLSRLRELHQERATLEGLRSGQLVAAGGVVRWQGKELRRRELPGAIAAIEHDIGVVETALRAHDARARALHRRAAERAGAGWRAWLEGLLAAHHYAEHNLADIEDSLDALHHTYRVVTADGKVSSAELKRLIDACNGVHAALATFHATADQLSLGPVLAQRLEVESWAAAMGEFKLPPATKDNISEWLGAVDSWAHSPRSGLHALRHASLELLLEAEEQVATALRDASTLGSPPEAPRIPASYPLLPPGKERERTLRLSWWDRFQLADGWLAGAARFSVAACVVGGVLWLGTGTGHTRLVLFNGLGTSVEVNVDGAVHRLDPGAHREVDIDTGRHEVTARLPDGTVIEQFAPASEGASRLVYNVAGAAPMLEWTATYGDVREVPDRPLGIQRWFPTRAAHVFTDPPESISTKGKGGTRLVLSALGGGELAPTLGNLDDDKAQQWVLRAHALWDAPDSPHLAGWLYAATSLADFRQLLAERLARHPHDMLSLRLWQDSAEGEESERICAEHAAWAAREPDSADALYLALRCMPDGAAQNGEFIAAHRRWPQHGWLQFAAAYAHAEQAQWSEALSLLRDNMTRLPQMANRTSDDLLRLMRVNGVAVDEQQDLAERYGYANYVMALEAAEGEPESSGYHAYPLLERGELAAAVSRAADDPQHAQELILLAAASDGATATQIEAGLALDDAAAVSAFSAWPGLALALREQRDSDAALARAMRSGTEEEVQALAGFLFGLHAGKPPQAAEAELGALRIQARGMAYASAAVLLGERCPENWRQAAKALLFNFERPYLR